MACLSVEKPPQTRVQTLLSAKRKTAIICLHATWTTLLGVVVVVVVVVVAVVVVVVVAVVVVVVEEEMIIMIIIMIIITIAVVITLLIPLGTGITNNSSYHHRSGINCGTTVHGSMAATIRLTTIMRVANRKAIKNSDDRTT